MTSTDRYGRTNRSALGLTADEHLLLSRLMSDPSRERRGNEPWERAWWKPYTSYDGRLAASLARKGLIESSGGRPSAKLGPRYRWRKEP